MHVDNYPHSAVIVHVLQEHPAAWIVFGVGKEQHAPTTDIFGFLSWCRQCQCKTEPNLQGWQDCTAGHAFSQGGRKVWLLTPGEADSNPNESLYYSNQTLLHKTRVHSYYKKILNISPQKREPLFCVGSRKKKRLEGLQETFQLL